MKNLILILVVFLNIITLNAQTSRGNLIIGGSVDFNSSKNKFTYPNSGIPNSTGENKYNSFNLSPSIGYFVATNLSLGFVAGLTNSQQSYKTSDSNGNAETIYNTKTKSLGIFARKYFLNAKNFGFYTGLSAVAGPSKRTVKSHNYNFPETSFESNGMNVSVGLNAGLAYFPTSRIGLQAGIAGIGWVKNSGKSAYKPNGEESTYENNSFNFNLNSLTLNFGLYYLFALKK